MQQEVFIDLYILINISMDLLCLMITAALLHRRVRRLRAVAAALIGGLYSAASLLLGLDGGVGFLGDLLAAVLMCTVTFGIKKRTVRSFLHPIPILLLVSMLLGGVMTGLYSLLNRLHLPFETLQGDGLSVWSFALLTAVAGLVTARGGRFLGLSQKTKTVTLRLSLFGKSLTLTALVDSGNLLQDPVSGKSVIVADIERLAPVLPPALLRACRSGEITDFLASDPSAHLCHPIPAKTASGQSLLLALVPDALTLTVKQTTYPADYLIAPAPLGTHAQGFDAVIGLD